MKDELIYWLALKRITGIGAVNYLRLIRHFGSPKKAFESRREELDSLPAIPQSVIKSILEFKGWRDIEKELKDIKRHGIGLVTINDKSYPKSLARIHDPPPFLYQKGEILPEDSICLAVVGARNASSYGRRMSWELGKELAKHNITVVSGLARGIDSAAHRGALDGRGRTIAVLGCGLDVPYPAENQTLKERILKRGAVISELPLSTLPEGGNFPARNRIISGLSLGVVIIEATMKSGSLITARFAIEQGREVFAVPGPVSDKRSRGTNMLIKNGAKLIEGVSDVLDEILPQARPTEDTNIMDMMDREEKDVFQALDEGIAHIDNIIIKTNMPPQRMADILLKMELKGLIEQLPGKYFSKRAGH